MIAQLKTKTEKNDIFSVIYNKKLNKVKKVIYNKQTTIKNSVSIMDAMLNEPTEEIETEKEPETEKEIMKII